MLKMSCRVFGLGLAFVASPLVALDVKTGFGAIPGSTTKIDVLHYAYAGREVAPNLSLGQTVYSAAAGTGGGAFFWGYSAHYGYAISQRVSLVGHAFIGGGGGASIVFGDGLMTVVGGGLSYAISDALSLDAGISHVKLTGSALDNTMYSLGVSYDFDKTEQNKTARPRLVRVAPRLSYVVAGDVLNTRNRPQTNIALAGVEASFSGRNQNRSYFVAADGAAKGAQGYMQLLAGVRQAVPLGKAKVFGELAAGFGGGGLVRTGGGAIVNAGVGVHVPLGQRHGLELSFGHTSALDGPFRGQYGQLRVTREFGRSADQAPQDWVFSTGFTGLFPNPSSRPHYVPGNPTIVLQETSFDMALSKTLYATGSALTVIDGHAGGFAMGLVGLGATFPLSPKLNVAVEGHIGAAGGGNVEIGGGLIGGARVEFDYALSKRASLSLGLGHLRGLRGDAFAADMVQAGIKIPFRSR